VGNPLRCGRCRAHTAPPILYFLNSIHHGKRDAIKENKVLDETGPLKVNSKITLERRLK